MHALSKDQNLTIISAVMRQRLYRAQWGKCKEVEVLVTVNGLFSVMWLEEPQRFGVFCLSIMLSPTPFSPSPNNWTPCCTPHDPSGSPRLYQWALYIRIPSQRQEPPALVKSFPLTVIMRNTNHMLDTKWFHIIELPNKKSKWYVEFHGCYPWAWYLPA